MKMQRFHSRVFQTCGLFAISGVLAFAQGTGPTSTCSTAPTSVTAFNIEQSVNLGLAGGTPGGPAVPNLGSPVVFTTLTPNIPPAALPAIVSGAVELREQVSLNTQANLLTVQGFTAAAGSPSPTTPGNINFSALLW